MMRQIMCNSRDHSPRLAPGLHVVGQGHVVAPDIILPLAETENPTEDAAAVDPNPHVQLDVSGLDHGPEGKRLLLFCVPSRHCLYNLRPFIIVSYYKLI